MSYCFRNKTYHSHCSLEILWFRDVLGRESLYSEPDIAMNGIKFKYMCVCVCVCVCLYIYVYIYIYIYIYNSLQVVECSDLTRAALSMSAFGIHC